MPRPSRLLRSAGLAAAVAIVAVACGDRSGKVLDEPVFPPPVTTVAVSSLPSGSIPPDTAPALPSAPMELVAPWVDGTPIPDRHTCAGAGVSPALTWTNVPAGTVELAVSVIDEDADGFVHWIVYAITPVTPGLVEGQIPAATFQWPNSSGSPDWSAPCPPDGETHRYRFTVYALNQQLEAADDAPATELLSILNAISIAQASVSGVASGGG
jgi:hypothetical protein